jgi:putative protease
MELLAPAGSPEALDAAVGEGADAVYLGLKSFNARLRSANFTYGQFEAALRAMHKMKKKVYVTVNTVFEQREADRMYQLLKYLDSRQPDALIVQDFGVIAMARAHFPSLRLHASTQMNIASARGANALSRHGVSRVVLARELSLEEMRGIKNETNLELEVFVHGALCISVSGLCLFSSYLGGKSANRGMCTQACRRLYRRADDSGQNGYYFSPNDLQLLEKVPDLAETGITALKIEGRMKSASYVGTVVSAYRIVLDALANGDESGIRESIERGQEILKNDFARPKTQYFFGGIDSVNIGSENTSRGDAETQRRGEEEGFSVDWLNPEQDGGTGISLGNILKVKGAGNERRALVCPPWGMIISARDSVRIHHSDDSGRVSQKLTFAEEARGAAGSLAVNSYWISAPEGETGDSVYLIQTKATSKRYTPVIGKVTGGKGPGREKAPTVVFPQKEKPVFPEGLYAAVSRPEDLYVLQSSRPQRVILSLTEKNAKYLLKAAPLPFKPAEIILSLDPWFPQDTASYETGKIAEWIEALAEKGYAQFIVNNPGHFSLFKGNEKVQLIAGPWLYMFNSWSLSFISSFGVDGFISPLENNRQNLEKTLGKSRLHSKFFITVFAWPALFNIRADLGKIIKINQFEDNNGDLFSLVTNHGGSRVYPKKYFSIIDKIPFLKEAGFGRFIIDLSGNSGSLKKTDYRDMMRAINENAILPNSSRFNWKNGFYG